MWPPAWRRAGPWAGAAVRRAALVALLASLVPCYGFDLRVAKGMYTRGYDSLRVSVITSGPEDVPAPWQWSWKAPFQHHWRSKTLHSQIVRAAGQSVSLGGESVRLELPSPGGHTAGLLLSDPCFTSRGGFRCPNGGLMKILDRLTQILNKLLASDDFHFWGILGDNFYDMRGEVTSEFFSRLSTVAKSKPFLTVVGNHDFWMSGQPPGLPIDSLGYGFTQFYGQDTVAATRNAPYNLSGDPKKMEIPAAENFIFGTQIGDLAFFGYSGAHDWKATYPHAMAFCRWVGGAPTVHAVVLLGHWNLPNLGCHPQMDVPSVYRRLKGMEGCKGKLMLYFMGHEHCNKVTEQGSGGVLDAFGFMIGGMGMWGTGCSQFGITVLRSVPGAPGGPNVAVEHVPLAEDDSFGKDPLQLAEGFDEVLACLNISGFGGCREKHALSFRAVSEDKIVKPRPLRKVTTTLPSTTTLPARSTSTATSTRSTVTTSGMAAATRAPGVTSPPVRLPPPSPLWPTAGPVAGPGAIGFPVGPGAGPAAGGAGGLAVATRPSTSGPSAGPAAGGQTTGAAGGTMASAGPASAAPLGGIGMPEPTIVFALAGGALAGGGAVAIVAALVLLCLHLSAQRAKLAGRRLSSREGRASPFLQRSPVSPSEQALLGRQHSVSSQDPEEDTEDLSAERDRYDRKHVVPTATMADAAAEQVVRPSQAPEKKNSGPGGAEEAALLAGGADGLEVSQHGPADEGAGSPPAGPELLRSGHPADFASGGRPGAGAGASPSPSGSDSEGKETDEEAFGRGGERRRQL